MSPSVYTQLVQEKPIVLLIAHRHWLTKKVRQFLERQDLEVIHYSPDEVMAQPSFLTQAQGLYKVIWLMGWTQSDASSSALLPLARELQQSGLPLTVVVRADVPFIQVKSPVIPEPWRVQQNHQLFWLELVNNHLLRANVIVGSNVIGEDQVGFPLAFITSQLSLQVLCDPELELSLQSGQAFAQQIMPLLLQPGVVRKHSLGNQFSSQAVIREIRRRYQLYHQVSLVERNQPVPIQSLALPTEGRIPALEETLPSLLEPLVRALPSPAQALAYLERPAAQLAMVDPSTIQPKNITVPPLVIPTIKRQDLSPTSKDSGQAKKVSVAQRQVTKPILKSVVTRPTQVPHSDTISDSHPALTSTNSSTPVKVKVPLTNQTPEIKEQSLTEVKPNLEFDAEIAKLFSQHRTDYKVERLENLVQKTHTWQKKAKKRQASFWLGVGFVSIGVIVVGLIGLFFSSKWWLYQNLLESARVATERSQGTTAPRSLTWVSSAVDLQYRLYSPFLPSPLLGNVGSVVEAAREFETLYGQMEKINHQQRQLVLHFVGKTPFEGSITQEKTLNEVQKAFQSLSKLEARFEEFKELYPDQESHIQQFLNQVRLHKDSLATYQQLQPLFSPLLGLEEKRVYAVVLQNNQELRPTGGFVQAVAFVTVHEGMIIDVQTVSSYELDEKLGGSVRPPADLQRLLNEERWYLRDSNWSPDFKAAGQRMAWFIEQESNKKIDGVIALNINTIAEILKTTGPLDIPEFNEVITDRNLAERMEFHSELPLTDAHKNQDYGAIILRKFFQKLALLPEDNVGDLLKTTNKLLNSKELLVYLENSGEQASVGALGWTGELIKPNCPPSLQTTECQVESIAVIDSNVGINKANYHLQRQDVHTIEVGAQAVKHQRSVTFTNTAKTAAWPQGDYRSYLRFYLPPNAQVDKVLLNDQPAPSDVLSQQQEEQFLVVGLVSLTPIQKSTRIQLFYSTPLVQENDMGIVFFNHKQPGLEQPLSKVSLTHPDTLKPAIIAPQAEVVGTTITFSPVDNDHFFAGVSFK